MEWYVAGAIFGIALWFYRRGKSEGYTQGFNQGAKAYRDLYLRAQSEDADNALAGHDGE